jgi:P-type Mg2+ transporter
VSRNNEVFGIDRRKAIVTAVVALLLAVLAVGVIGQVTSFHDMLDALRAANDWWFPVCLLGELLAYTGYIVAYRDIARVDGGPRLPLWTVIRVVGVGFGAFIAGSSFGTLGVDYWALHKAGDSPHRAVRRVLALNTLEWAVLATAAAVSGALLLAGIGGTAPRWMEVAWVGIVPVCVGAALWVTARSRVERFTAVPPREGRGRIRRSLRVAFADAIGGVVLVRKILASPRRYPFAVLGFPLFWAGDILTMYAAIRAFGADVDLLPLILAYTTAYVVTSLPLPAGGAGGVEAGLTFSLHAVGVPLAPALLATLVYRFFTMWLPLGIAVLALTQVKALSKELPLVEHEPAPG